MASTGINSRNNRNRSPISNIPVKWARPQMAPIFQAFRFRSMANGVTAARWSGPEITWSMAASRPEVKANSTI